MALTLLSHEVSDLCIGKPPLRCLSAVTATVADAIAALKSSDEPFLSVWSCNHDETNDDDDNKKCDCECLGKICMADVICYLSKFDNKVLSLSSAFNASVSVLLHKCRSIVVHVQSSCKYVTIHQDPGIAMQWVSFFLVHEIQKLILVLMFQVS